jgi:hypothetical protein
VFRSTDQAIVEIEAALRKIDHQGHQGARSGAR